jgi:hypothetical protein
MSRMKWAAVGWSAMILALCWIPRDLLFALERRAVGDIELGVFNVDKLVHVALFVGFGWLWCRALAGRPRGRAARAVLVGGVVFALLSEVVQIHPWIGRSIHILDILSDLAGLGLGVWLALRFVRPAAVAPAARAEAAP